MLEQSIRDMCDYSLMGGPNRLARQGEELIIHRFPTGTLGLASPADLNRVSGPGAVQGSGFWGALLEFFTPRDSQPVAAVCIPPGAILSLHDVPAKLQNELGIGPDERVIFTQTTAAVNHYRDAVRFRGGREVQLQHLHEGQRVEVISLASALDRDIAEFADFPSPTR
jgi:hypothetical protein